VSTRATGDGASILKIAAVAMPAIPHRALVLRLDTPLESGQVLWDTRESLVIASLACGTTAHFSIARAEHLPVFVLHAEAAAGKIVDAHACASALVHRRTGSDALDTLQLSERLGNIGAAQAFW
jgi:hypothetical protein